MKADERLLVLCEEFADLDEDEKEQILEFSQAIGSIKKSNSRQNTKTKPPSVSEVKKTKATEC